MPLKGRWETRCQRWMVAEATSCRKFEMSDANRCEEKRFSPRRRAVGPLASNPSFGSDKAVLSASANASGSLGGTSRPPRSDPRSYAISPHSSAAKISRGPPSFAAMTGVPHAIHCKRPPPRAVALWGVTLAEIKIPPISLLLLLPVRLVFHVAADQFLVHAHGVDEVATPGNDCPNTVSATTGGNS